MWENQLCRRKLIGNSTSSSPIQKPERKKTFPNARQRREATWAGSWVLGLRHAFPQPLIMRGIGVFQERADIFRSNYRRQFKRLWSTSFCLQAPNDNEGRSLEVSGESTPRISRPKRLPHIIRDLIQLVAHITARVHGTARRNERAGVQQAGQGGAARAENAATRLKTIAIAPNTTLNTPQGIQRVAVCSLSP